MATKRRTAAYSEATLIQSAREALAIARGTRMAARITEREAIVTKPPVFSAKRIQRARAQLGFSQAVFARALNVSPATVRAWEQGNRVPDGAAVRLLELTNEFPEWLESKVRHVAEARATYAVHRRGGTSRARK